MNFSKRVIGGGLAALALALAAVGAATIGQAGDTPGRTVSALDRIPPAAVVPVAVQEWAGRVAHGRNPTAVRRLRVNLGSRQSDVFAYRSGQGGVCFLYVGYAGTCSTARHIRQTGIQWTLGAGTFVALVTDDVETVRLTVDQSTYPVSLVNNVAFAEYSDGNVARISVTYANGASEIATVRLNGPLPLSPKN